MDPTSTRGACSRHEYKSTEDSCVARMKAT
ncbi:hypothetical protein GQ600_4417 [Phytophthora cactorum]|nr:hypothetical protein GQ600_23010 [Phytophthora cactorum]KAF1783876.1 hypothetical protein GQ600_4417 [Phytophthora cactorum]